MKEERRQKFLLEHPDFYKKEKISKYIYEDYFKDIPESIKTLSRTKLNHLRKRGKIKRKPCKVCGEINSQAHHRDYSNPYKVVWLCSLHHRRAHQKLNRKLIFKNKSA